MFATDTNLIDCFIVVNTTNQKDFRNEAEQSVVPEADQPALCLPWVSSGPGKHKRYPDLRFRFACHLAELAS